MAGGKWAALAVARLAVAASGAESLDFMVIGDWGGLPVWPYRSPGESGVAKQLGILASEVQARYALSLGDNFYTTGVKSVEDPRFQETFERVFKNPSLQGRDFFRVLAGNHDHKGNCSAQIAYSDVSQRWHFPSYYYDFVETAPNGRTVHTVMIDTVLLSGQTADFSSGEDGALTGWNYPGPENVQVAEAQWDWINRTLATSTADYLLVAGHFPVWSICEHGPTKILVERLRPLLQAHHVSAYLAGHDHCAEHLEEGGVEYHGVGAGVEIGRSTTHSGAVPPGSLKWHLNTTVVGILEGAFAHVSVGDEGLVVTHYFSSGKKLYEAPAIKPRSHEVIVV